MPSRKLGRNPVVQAWLPVGTRRREVVAHAVRRVWPSGRPRMPGPDEMGRQRDEENKLRDHWSGYAPQTLDIYLVSGFQDPRLNAQSILGRHTLVRALFGSEFDTLMHEELTHAAKLNETLRRRAVMINGGLRVTLNPMRQARVVQPAMELVADEAPIFAQRWRQALAGRRARRLRVIEFACGSANDYRAFADYGIAEFIDYTGIDLNRNNVANARRRFPLVDFRVGSILSLSEKTRSADYVIGYDIMEHLSLQGMHTALEAAERISRRGLYFAFFRMDQVPEHEEAPRRNHHSNVLSASRIRKYMERRYRSVQLIHIAEMFENEYNYPHFYNPRAYSLIAAEHR